MIITEIKVSRKLTEIFCENESVALVYSDIWKKSGYKEGDDISFESLEEIKYDSDFKKGKERALYLLTSRDFGKKELIKKLSSSVSKEIAQDICDYIEELGLINDEKYAASMASYLMNTKGYGEKRAIYELCEKGIDKDVALNAVLNIETDPVEKIISIVERKYKTALYDEKVYNRCVNALIRYGYKYGEIRNAFEILKEQERQ